MEVFREIFPPSIEERNNKEGGTSLINVEIVGRTLELLSSVLSFFIQIQTL